MIIEKYPVKGESNPYRVKLKCDTCGHITDTTFNKQREERIKKLNGKTFCRACNNKIEGKKKRGNPSPKLGKRYDHLRRENSPKWKGGRYIDFHGYVMILVDDGPRQKDGWKRYKKEHVIVMESLLGRKLKKGESIHHIDVDKINNAPDNLFLYTNEQDHKNIHKSLEKIGIDLLKLGLVRFNKKNMKYEMLFNPAEIIK